MQVDARHTTGLPSLDRVLCGLIPGDNLVWQVETVEDYALFVHPYVAAAAAQGRRLIYFRFAHHPPLVDAGPEVETHAMHPEGGFESFIAEIHGTIERAGHGAHYVFDSLSDLAVDWYSDQMLGNFFMLTCPYLYDVKAVAYFGLLRGRHAADASGPIMETAQVVIDVHRHDGRIYVHPLKVQQRYSPTMHLLHAWADEVVSPIADSGTIASVMGETTWSGLALAGRGSGLWDRAFAEAERAVEEIAAGARSREDTAELLGRLLCMVISRDKRVLQLAERYLTLEDLLAVRKRLIGTGLVGGKSVGMLVARSILRRKDPAWVKRLEPHDSFYVGADVYFTFVVRNGTWWVREKQKDPATFLDGAETARQRLLTGSFPESVRRQFADMLDYFGQWPIVVRSSSLLEDDFGNSFAGKYDTIFCANQGPHQKRLEDFLSAVRTIYASTMSESALAYRARRGLLKRDEQMALLVQRVSGGVHGRLFFPQAAGVALSYNPYVWSEYIDPKAGVARLVFGLGTRAVERSDDDYTRIVALNDPQRRLESTLEDLREYAQRRVDVIDLEAGQLASLELPEIVRQAPGLPLDIFASRDTGVKRDSVTGAEAWILTFDRLLSETDFVPHMRELLGALEDAYGVPVDTEFAVNFLSDRSCKINLLQCRPLQVKGIGLAAELPQGLERSAVLLEAHGAVIGHSRVVPVHRIVYVVSAAYAALSLSDCYSVARLIGRITRLPAGERAAAESILMLVGPGRWGTTTPSLGVPVSFAEISAVGALCEIVAMRDDLVPDVSLGTHFFGDLVECDILYSALFPERRDNYLSRLEDLPNSLEALLPDAAAWAPVVKVVEASAFPGGLCLAADTRKQKVVVYRGREAAASRESCAGPLSRQS